MVQDAVRKLCATTKQLTDDLDESQLAIAVRHLDDLVHPLSGDDICALMSMLPEDGDTACGLNWTILHAIEASPVWPIWDLLQNERHEWVDIFRVRLSNAGIAPPS